MKAKVYEWIRASHRHWRDAEHNSRKAADAAMCGDYTDAGRWYRWAHASSDSAEGTIRMMMLDILHDGRVDGLRIAAEARKEARRW